MDSDVKHVDTNEGETAPEPVEEQGAVEPAPADAPEPETDSELEAMRDRLLRVTAEFDNYRKRIDRERREMTERAAEGVLSELLPIVDDLERALDAESTGEAIEAYQQGVALIHRQLLDLLARRGVTPINALGADFDPHLHQAVASEPVDDARDGEIVEEFRRGYKLGDRLLRPAMVKVAKA